MQSAQLFCSIYKLKLQANWMQSSWWRWAGSPFLFHSASGVLSGRSVWLRTTHAACSHMLHCRGITAEIHTAAVRSLLFWYGIEGVVHPKMKVLSSFIHPQVFPNLYDLVSPVEYKCLSIVPLTQWKSKLFGSQLHVKLKEMHVWNDKLLFLCGLSL